MNLTKCASILSLSVLLAATVNGCSNSPTVDDDSGTTTDGPAPPKDAAKDAPAKVDTGGGTDTGGPSGCTPADVSGFTPSALKPAKTPSTACTQVQVDTYWSSCLDQATASSSKCSAFTGNTANKACATCLVSNKTDASWGPLVQGKGIIWANVSGCLQIKTGDSTTGGCAYKFQASQDCQDAACAANCPVTDDASFAEYNACSQEAADNGCKTYSDAADAACPTDASVIASCFGTDFKGFYDIVCPLFCVNGTGG